ncbi:MAG TPA: HlyD family efflux transporter periplasmic adaptor subunit [Chloroflexia bacterium]|nr:HlyD family efflux transporter periplasmic adaptor subunit [Chloroflexia bacterium]
MRLPFSRKQTITTSAEIDAPQTLKRPIKRRKKLRNKIGLIITLLLVAVTGGGFLFLRSQHTAPTAQTTIGVPVVQGNLDINVESSGSVHAEKSASVQYKTTGTVEQVLVKVGDKVEAGQPLVRLSNDTQTLAVQEAEASLNSARATLEDLNKGSSLAEIAGAEAEVQSARANLQSVMSGATPREIADAQAELRAAQAELTTVKAGATPGEISDAQADLKAAQAKLDEVKLGSTASDISDAQADLKEAQAKLEAVKAGATPKEIADAEADLKSAQAGLDTLKAPASAEEVAAAEADLTAAQLKVQALEKGATEAEKSKAQLAVTEAEAALNKTRTDTAAAKQEAELALSKAQRDLEAAQREYGRISAETLNENGELVYDAWDPRAEQYYEAFNKLKDAETAYYNAQSTVEQARQKEKQDVGIAEAQLANARAQLQDLLDGPTTAELAEAHVAVTKAQKTLSDLTNGPKQDKLAEAEAAVIKARTKLEELRAGPKQGDLASAEAEVAKAQSKLNGLKAGPTMDELAEAEAAVVKASTKLNELRGGPTPDELAEAQVAVDKAQNNLNELRAGPTPAKIAEAESKVAQAQAKLQELQEPAGASEIAAAEEAVVKAQKNLAEAQQDLEDTTLVAPFGGTVSAVGAVANAQVEVGKEAVQIFDGSGMYLNLSVPEADVEKLKVGQSATITIDAVAGQTITGTVSSVSPIANSGSDAVTYAVKVTFNPGTLSIKVGMSANATIRLERKANAVQVPNRAIKQQGPFKTVRVLYGENETPVEVRVQTGATNGQTTEIVSCLDTGNQCLRAGDKVAMTMSTVSGQQAAGGQDVVFIGPGGGMPPPGDGGQVSVGIPIAP